LEFGDEKLEEGGEEKGTYRPGQAFEETPTAKKPTSTPGPNPTKKHEQNCESPDNLREHHAQDMWTEKIGGSGSETPQDASRGGLIVVAAEKVATDTTGVHIHFLGIVKTNEAIGGDCIDINNLGTADKTGAGMGRAMLTDCPIAWSERLHHLA
jgi:hypothetical protein